MAPLAPGLFSTTTGWPSDLLSGSDSARAMVSVNEPAGKPTTMRTGRVGHLSSWGAWAWAAVAAHRVRHGARHRARAVRSEEHTSELQSPCNLVCRLLLE